MAKVLIADDSEAFRRLNAEILKMDGHQVLMARNGRETLEVGTFRAPGHPPARHHMPGLDGFEVCRELKGDPSPGNSVVMVTALSESVRYRALRPAPTNTSIKPITSRRIRDLVRI